MNEREQLAKDNGMTIEFVNWFFDNKKDGCGNAWFIMMAAMWEGWSGREAKCAAQARNEGINYAASRLAAAFNHGFVDKPLTEVCDVVRMILDTKEDLANSTLPAADGLSGEYAEKFLEEFAAQLRQEAQ